MEGGADNGAGNGADNGDGGGRLQSAPQAGSVMEPDEWCTLTAVQKAAKLVVVRLRASIYPFKRQKKHTRHTRHALLVAGSPGLHDVLRYCCANEPGRVRRHMRRDRKSLFISKPLTWTACY